MNEIEIKDFRSVTAAAELTNIRPVEMSAAVLAPPPPDGSAIELGLKSSMRLERTAQRDFTVAVRFDVTARDEKQAQDYARFVYSVTASYVLPENVEFSDEELQPFARYNSMIHLWPYMRAFVQSICGQLMIPPVLVPVFRVTDGGRMAWQRVENGDASAEG